MAPERIEGLIGHLGRLPLEVVLASFLFQLVGTYVEFKADALVEAIVARLDSAHDNLQARAPPAKNKFCTFLCANGAWQPSGACAVAGGDTWRTTIAMRARAPL